MLGGLTCLAQAHETSTRMRYIPKALSPNSALQWEGKKKKVIRKRDQLTKIWMYFIQPGTSFPTEN